MNQTIMFLLALLCLGLLIVIFGLISSSYVDYIDRNRHLNRVQNKFEFSNAIDLKGLEGEENVKNFMESVLSYGEYYLRNLLIPISECKIVEIDGVLITRKGVFCIESKNWKGRINGFDRDDIWYQTKCNKARQVKNPVIQNEFHKKTIEKILNFDYRVSNCVILSSTRDLSHIVSNHTFNIESFEKYYSSLEKRRLSLRKVRLACDKLSLFLATNDDIKKYKENIRSKIAGL